MSLTKDDLKAIAGVVKEIVDDAIELSDQRTAVGFAEVHGRIDGLSVGLHRVESGLDEVKVRLGTVENTVGRIEMQQRAMIDQLDDHSVRLNKVEGTLKLKAA